MTTKLDIMVLRLRASLGSGEAMCVLGNNYLYGIGVEVDLEKAHEYFEKAAAKNIDAAKTVMANVFADDGHSTELKADFMGEGYEKLRDIILKADKGNPEAIFLANAPRLDDECEDFRFFLAVKAMKKACRKGYAPALYALGRVYFSEKRIHGKKSEGFSMIRKSADKEFIPAIQYMMHIAPLNYVYDVVRRMAEKPDADGDVLQMLAEYYRQGIVVEKDYGKYVSLLKEAADKGCKDAFYNLGLTYEFGKLNVQKDINKAIAYYEKGVEQGSAECMLNLGYILEHSDDCPHDYKRAFELYSKASKTAELNVPMALNNMGTCYKRGIGTQKDNDKALACYTKAAEHGYIDAYWNLYLYYMDGICTERDYGKAVEWLIKGDLAGSLRCTYQLARHIKNGDGAEVDLERYFFYIKRAAMGGYKEAFAALGDCYRYGIGTTNDGNKAFKWYRKLSEFSLDGVARLGQCYTYGIGTKRDLNKAVELYTIAAEKGNAQAQFDLGICYRNGEGVQADPLMAIKWYLKAAEQGHGSALCNLGVMYDNGIGVDEDPVKALSFYKKSAETGNAEGQFCLGDMYFSGRGVERNYEEAVKWFVAAAVQGEPDSLFHLGLCYNDGLGVEREPDTAARFLYAAADNGWQQAVDFIQKNKIPRPKKH